MCSLRCSPRRGPDGCCPWNHLRHSSVKGLSTLSGDSCACSIGHMHAAGRAHGRDRLGQVDRGRAARGARARSSSTPTQIAREVVEPGQPALAALVERFGAEILAPTAASTGPRSRRVAFADDDGAQGARGDHPPGDRRGVPAPDRARRPPTRVVVLRRPAARRVRGRGARDYAAVIVVEAPLELRLDRLEARGVPRDDAERRMALQATDEERRAVATWVVDNAGDLDALERQVDDDLGRARSHASRRRAGRTRRDRITVTPRRYAST